MARITKKAIETQIKSLNMLLDRPDNQFSSKVGEPTRFAVGHICFQHDSSGYSLEEVITESGAVYSLGSGMSANETYYLLRGMISGIALRNAHIGQLLLRDYQNKNGKCETDHPLYDPALGKNATIIYHADGAHSVIEK